VVFLECSWSIPGVFLEYSWSIPKDSQSQFSLYIYMSMKERYSGEVVEAMRMVYPPIAEADCKVRMSVTPEGLRLTLIRGRISMDLDLPGYEWSGTFYGDFDDATPFASTTGAFKKVFLDMMAEHLLDRV
jgi:hypothetical protein